MRRQIWTLFGHLYPEKEVPVKIELDYERQKDDWSCGYRAVACVTCLARFENPVKFSFDLHAVYRLLLAVLDENRPRWKMFDIEDFSL